MILFPIRGVYETLIIESHHGSREFEASALDVLNDDWSAPIVFQGSHVWRFWKRHRRSWYISFLQAKPMEA